jgi:hypothetical protein
MTLKTINTFKREFQLNNILACRVVAMQRPRDGRIYQGRFWATARQKRSRGNRQERNNRRAVFSMWFVPRCYKQGTRLELSSVQESVKRGLEVEAEE